MPAEPQFSLQGMRYCVIFDSKPLFMPEQNDILSLQKTTESLLEKIDQDQAGPDMLPALRDVIRFHEHRYYVENDPLIADVEFDRLYKALEKLEKAHPSLVTPDSPTQRVASGLTESFLSTPHLVPMLSLDNSYDQEDLLEWDRKARTLAQLPAITYCVEPKFDGASISLVYENDQLVRAVTRGNGIEGDDITNNIRQIRSVPLSARFSDYGLQLVEIRGEVLMNKVRFKEYNDMLTAQQLPPLANPRNAAAGTLRIKDPAEVRRRNLEVFLYSISFYIPLPGVAVPELLNTHEGALEMLDRLGFRVPRKEKKVFEAIDGVVRYCAAFEAGRDELPFEIDGMVVKVNDVSLQERLGMTTHHPRWAIAYKFKARQATSRIQGVDFFVGRTGAITPVARIEPVPIGGVTVSNVSLFNEDVIREKDLRIGDAVLVERAGDVIPYIVKPLTDVRTGDEIPVIFPEKCPVCADPLVKADDEAVWRCININCRAQVVERMVHFASRDAMDIRGLGDALIRKFFELGILTDIPGIYHLPYDRIAVLEGFGSRSVANLQAATEKSKSQPLHRLIFGLGIRFVGETTAKTLAQAVKHLLELRDFTLEDLQHLEDIGPKVASSVKAFFEIEDNIRMLEQLEASGLSLKNTKRDFAADTSLAGQTFLFTGTLPTLKRSEAEGMVELHGGQVLSGVSSRLNYLVAGADAGSKLEKAKKIATVRIISEAEFLTLVSR